jgi:hypothetical protein
VCLELNSDIPHLVPVAIHRHFGERDDLIDHCFELPCDILGGTTVALKFYCGRVDRYPEWDRPASQCVRDGT